MQTIVIIHPEGNTTNNPGLSSIIGLLCQHYYIILVRHKIDEIYQEIKWENTTPVFFDNLYKKEYFSKYSKILSEYKFSLIIGIDQGIVFSNFLSLERDVPFGLISYEIFFRNEWDDRLKDREIKASKNVAFVICQDSMRSYLLSRENKIPIEIFFNIPISEPYMGPYACTRYLKEKFNISENKKIALYIGSIAEWAMIDKLCNCVKEWPEDWVLVLHSRYGKSDIPHSLFNCINSSSKIYLSTDYVLCTDELEKIICSADVGLALYESDLYSPYAGKNILFIGLSSGKIATYLKYDIPVIVNNGTNIADIVKDYNLGFVAVNQDDINPKNIYKNIEGYKKSCKHFYQKYLDFSLYSNAILSLISNIIAGDDTDEIFLRNNARDNIDTKSFLSIRFNFVYDSLRDELNKKKNKILMRIQRRLGFLLKIKNYLSKTMKKHLQR